MVHWTAWAVGVSAARVPTLGTSAGSLPGSEWLPPERPIVSAPGPRCPLSTSSFSRSNKTARRRASRLRIDWGARGGGGGAGFAVMAEDAITAMAAYLARHSEELLAGSRVLTLSTRELARVTARLQQLARLSELGGGHGASPGAGLVEVARPLARVGSRVPPEARVRPRVARGARNPEGRRARPSHGRRYLALVFSHNNNAGAAAAAPFGALAAEPRAVRVPRAARAARMRPIRRHASPDMGR